MSVRDQLAELINGRALPMCTKLNAIYERGLAYERADAVLARWRLVEREWVVDDRVNPLSI